MAENEEFMRMQQQAVERMREMSSHAVPSPAHTMPPAPPFVRTAAGTGRRTAEQPRHSEPPVAPAPAKPLPPVQPDREPGFLERLKTEPDLPLILGLLLLLWSENADRKLMLALAYIML